MEFSFKKTPDEQLTQKGNRKYDKLRKLYLTYNTSAKRNHGGLGALPPGKDYEFIFRT
jgi:hypothetical protein